MKITNMTKPKLTKEESEIYMKIVLKGTMDDMFDLGYVIGRERLVREHLEILTSAPKGQNR